MMKKTSSRMRSAVVSRRLPRKITILDMKRFFTYDVADIEFPLKFNRNAQK